MKILGRAETPKLGWQLIERVQCHSSEVKHRGKTHMLTKKSRATNKAGDHLELLMFLFWCHIVNLVQGRGPLLVR